jgi:hypothetical protein
VSCSPGVIALHAQSLGQTDNRKQQRKDRGNKIASYTPTPGRKDQITRKEMALRDRRRIVVWTDIHKGESKRIL